VDVDVDVDVLVRVPVVGCLRLFAGHPVAQLFATISGDPRYMAICDTDQGPAYALPAPGAMVF
jgi:hypothetical protein